VEAAAKARPYDVRPKTKMRIEVACAAVLSMLADRGADATICPSEVARRIAADASAHSGEDWRLAMPIIHAAVDHLVDQKDIRLSWKGRTLAARTGPYRISRANDSL
jgi:hypothetical protein